MPPADKPLIPGLVEPDRPSVRVEIDIPASTADRIAGWNVPAELCGDTLKEKIEFLIGEVVLDMVRADQDRQKSRRYREMKPDAAGIEDDGDEK